MPLRFYIGLHQPSDAQHFTRYCLHVQRLAATDKPLDGLHRHVNELIDLVIDQLIHVGRSLAACQHIGKHARSRVW